MTGPQISPSLRLSRLAVLGGTLLAMVAGCQSDGWRFAQRDPFGRPVAGQLADAGVSAPGAAAGLPSGVPRTVGRASYSVPADPMMTSWTIRGQYSSDAGVSMPVWNPRPSVATGAPASGYSATNSLSAAGSIPNNYPTTNYPAVGSSSAGVSSSSTAPPAASSGGMQPVEPNPPLASERNIWPRLVPPLTGDAAGMGPYEEKPAPDLSVYPSPLDDPTQELPLSILAEEAMTGRFMFSVGVNSDIGLMGSIIVDEQNFDWRRWPTSWEDIRSGKAWRGDGQRFRLEASPGTEWHRYLVSFEEPYLFDTQIRLGLMGQYYTRAYLDWYEQWLGGRIALGYHLTHSLTGSLAFRGMDVTVFHPVSPAPAELTDALGHSSLYGFQAMLAHDTRDSPFLATQGHLIEGSCEQVIGTYEYPQVNLDLRRYFMLHERPDGSGRQVLALSGRFRWTGDDTPIYEHFFAGGFTTIRGFDFRCASPRDPATGVFVGGHAMLLASAEYLFPITADDMLRGVLFCDTGTVERTLQDWNDKYRVAPGFGLRITVPAMGPAPIALDFAFPISHEPGDRLEMFSFWVGFLR